MWMGEPGTATVGVADVQVGDRVAFTDARGFTIGWSDMTALTPATRQLTLAVEQAPDGDVDRRYTLATDRGRVPGQRTLFYRNEIASFLGTAKENRYREDVATDGQGNLVIAEERGRRTRSRPSTADPLSDKVADARVAATPSGTPLRLLER